MTDPKLLFSVSVRAYYTTDDGFELSPEATATFPASRLAELKPEMISDLLGLSVKLVEDFKAANVLDSPVRPMTKDEVDAYRKSDG